MPDSSPAVAPGGGPSQPTAATDPWVGVLDGTVTAAVLAMAWWTVLFHGAVPLDLHRDLVGAVWAAGSALGIGWAARRRGTLTPLALRRVRLPAGPVAALAGTAVGAVALSATRWPDQRPQWWLFWLVVVAVVAGGLHVVTAGRAERPVDAPPSGPTSVAALVVVVLVALGAAAGSALTQRPDADDVFLVNRSTYVAEHPGPLPERDTLFSDEVFAVTRPDAVPTAIEPLVGVVAAWSPVTAPTVTYLVFGPAVAFLGVLALWRMLRTLGVVAPAVATAAAVGFLLLDGSNHYTFGSMGFVRSWQGKVAFLLVIVPALWHHGLRWARDGRRADLGWLVAANVAGIGLSTTAVLVGPSVSVVVLLAGCWGTGTWRRLLPGLAAAAPAAIAAGAFALIPRQDPTPVLGWVPPWFTLSGGIEPGRQWHWIYDEGLPLLLPAGAALVAWALVRDRSARLALLLAPMLLFGFFYGPGTFDAIADLSGVRAILWRTGWILPVPAAVGILVTAPLLWRHRSGLATVASVATAVAVAAVMLVDGTWVLDEDGGTQGVHLGLGWDVDPSDRAAAQRLIDLSEPGDTVVAPERIGQVIAIQTTRVRALNPRTQYMTGRHVVPELQVEARARLTQAVAAGTPDHPEEQLASDLAAAEPATVCVATGLSQSAPIVAALEEGGYQPATEDGRCTYWRAGP